MKPIDVWKSHAHSVRVKEGRISDLLTMFRSRKDRIGVLYNDLITNHPNSITYKTFQRLIAEMAERQIIKATKQVGAQGNTTMITFP